jgi:hypothetical protein
MMSTVSHEAKIEHLEMKAADEGVEIPPDVMDCLPRMASTDTNRSAAG